MFVSVYRHMDKRGKYKGAVLFSLLCRIRTLEFLLEVDSPGAAVELFSCCVFAGSSTRASGPGPAAKADS